MLIDHLGKNQLIDVLEFWLPFWWNHLLKFRIEQLYMVVFTAVDFLLWS